MRQIFRAEEEIFDLKAANFPTIISKPKKANVNVSSIKEKTKEKLDYEAAGKGIIEKAKKEAETIKNRANAEIEEMKEREKKEIEKQKRELIVEMEKEKKEGYASGFSSGEETGYKKGYQDGFGVGKKEAYDKTVDFANMLNKASQEISKFKEDVLREAESEIAKMSLSIARKVIHRELMIDPSVVVGVVRDALGKVYYKKKFIVYVNPLDFEIVQKEQDKIITILENYDSFSIKTSTRVDTGGCIVETESGTIDARVENQFEKVKESVLKAIGES